MTTPWKDAASIILCRPKRIKAFEVLLLKRSAKSGSFMPERFVFPGGSIAKRDTDPDWRPLLKRFGEIDLIERARPREPLNMRPRPEFDLGLDRRLALRICAVRETLEESGLFLYRGRQKLSGDTLEDLRQVVNKNADDFLSLCQQYQVCLDVWGLSGFAAW